MIEFFDFLLTPLRLFDPITPSSIDALFIGAVSVSVICLAFNVVSSFWR